MSISVLRISEMKWTQTRKCQIEAYTLYYSGENGTQNRNGVAIIVNKDVNSAVLSVAITSETIIQSMLYSNDEIIEDTMSYEGCWDKKKEITILIGNLNAKAEQGRAARIIGTAEHIVRNKIDYITIKHRYKNCIKSVNTYSGADVRAIITCFWPYSSQVKIDKTANQTEAIDIEELENPQIKDELTGIVKGKLREIDTTQEINIEKVWNKVKVTINETTKLKLKREESLEKKKRIKEKIL
ncbi:hypothetical protein ILUMI_19170 [Ignelater luminosus]|uniref:Uncharacterized protein n=1 Tax=Ignelater luminosus TaxID=2038154 RepID=A0A8K0CGN5_IGNLU|nr:hypothetical protein ILUMI_19170 [Ignelater luminosus]